MKDLLIKHYYLTLLLIALEVPIIVLALGMIYLSVSGPPVPNEPLSGLEIILPAVAIGLGLGVVTLLGGVVILRQEQAEKQYGIFVKLSAVAVVALAIELSNFF